MASREVPTITLKYLRSLSRDIGSDGHKFMVLPSYLSNKLRLDLGANHLVEPGEYGSHTKPVKNEIGAIEDWRFIEIPAKIKVDQVFSSKDVRGEVNHIIHELKVIIEFLSSPVKSAKPRDGIAGLVHEMRAAAAANSEEDGEPTSPYTTKAKKRFFDLPGYPLKQVYMRQCCYETKNNPLNHTHCKECGEVVTFKRLKPFIAESLKDENEKLEAWLRFFTGNSTNERELFLLINAGYRYDVRRTVAKEVSEYFNKKDDQ
jgi:hypothetical protein